MLGIVFLLSALSESSRLLSLCLSVLAWARCCAVAVATSLIVHKQVPKVRTYLFAAKWLSLQIIMQLHR